MDRQGVRELADGRPVFGKYPRLFGGGANQTGGLFCFGRSGGGAGERGLRCCVRASAWAIMCIYGAPGTPGVPFAGGRVAESRHSAQACDSSLC